MVSPFFCGILFSKSFTADLTSDKKHDIIIKKKILHYGNLHKISRRDQ